MNRPLYVPGMLTGLVPPLRAWWLKWRAATTSHHCHHQKLSMNLVVRGALAAHDA